MDDRYLKLTYRGNPLGVSFDDFAPLRRSDDVLHDTDTLHAHMEEDGYLFLPGLLSDGSGQALAVQKLSNPLGTSSIRTLVGRAIRIFTGIAGSVAFLMFIYGGFTWLTSGGSPERIKKGKDTFIWATIGLIIIFSAYTILTTLFRSIGAGT